VQAFFLARYCNQATELGQIVLFSRFKDAKKVNSVALGRGREPLEGGLAGKPASRKGEGFGGEAAERGGESSRLAAQPRWDALAAYQISKVRSKVERSFHTKINFDPYIASMGIKTLRIYLQEHIDLKFRPILQQN